MQVEIIRFPKQISPLFTLTFAKRGIRRDRRVYAWKIVTTACSTVITSIIRDLSPLFCAESSHGKSFPHVPVR